MDFILCLLSICLLEHVSLSRFGIGIVFYSWAFSPSCHSKGLNQVGERASEDLGGSKF